MLTLVGAGCASAPVDGPENSECSGERFMGHSPNLSGGELFQARMLSQDLGIGAVQPELYALGENEVTVLNPSAVLRYLDRQYRPAMRVRGSDAAARVLLLIGKEGKPSLLELSEGTGQRDLDDIAERVAARADFTPLTRDGTPVCYWVVLPLSFATR